MASGFLSLGARLALVDSSASNSEIRAIYEVLSRASFAVVGLGIDFVRGYVDQEAKNWAGREAALRYAREPSARLGSDVLLATEILHALFFVAAADGVIKEPEAAFLREVAESLGLSSDVFRAVWNHWVVTEDGREGGRPDEDERREAAVEAYRRTFAIGVVVLSAKLSKADGRVTQSEIDGFRAALRRLPKDTTEGIDVASVFNRAKTSTEGYLEVAQKLAELYESRMLEALLDCLFEVAWADGVFHSSESEYLGAVGRCFGFSDSELREIRARWLSATAQEVDPYTVLGLSHEVADVDLKRRYRQLVIDHHPDRLAGKGLPSEQMQAANARLAAINAAYGQILSERSA